MVVHLLLDTEVQDPPQVGFVVSKAVGNAVHRNVVKRRLRHAAASHLTTLPAGSLAVVRALPPSRDADYGRLDQDLSGSLTRAVARATARVVGRDDRST